MKKTRLIRWLALLLTGALLLCFAACTKKQPKDPPPEETTESTEKSTTTTEAPTITEAPVGSWRIELRGVPNVLFFSSEDAQYLPKVQIEMTTTNLETGLSSKDTYGGITLRSLLNYCGVQNVVSVTVVSVLGPSAVYNETMSMAEDTVLAWEKDGAPLDFDPPLRMCPRSGTAEMFIKQVSSINVVPSAGVPETVTWSEPPPGNNDPAPTTWGTTTWATVPTTETTTTTTTTTTVSRTPWTTITFPPYVGPSTTNSATLMEKPSWWPKDEPWPPK
ncbi:MAG: molybdopterin-dependent oxidoreductase [Oscillospiraceae bacterium]|nr:molybdopterin-dependent oxidoreductase [Oscillospiraceae bacterium]